MLKLLIYEFKKTYGNSYIRYSIVILLTINILLCLFSVLPNEGEMPTSVITSFFDEYINNRDLIETEYNTFLEWEKLQLQLEEQQLLLGNHNFQREPFVNRFAPDGYSDAQLYRILFQQKSYIASYKNTVNTVITDALSLKNGYIAMGFSENSFPCSYQTNIINQYDKLLSTVKLGFEYVHGWNDYFSFEPTIILIFFAITIINILIALYESSSGFAQLMRVSKNGRTKVFLAKAIVSITTSAIITCIFMLTTWILIGIIDGYSNSGNNIQIIPDFLYCPFDVTILTVFLYDLLLKISSFALFSCFILMISMFVRNYIFAFLCGIGTICLSFFTAEVLPVAIKYLNFFNVASTDIFFERFQATNILGIAVNSIYFSQVTYIIVTLIIILLITFYCSTIYGNTTKLPLILPNIQIKSLVMRNNVSTKNHSSLFYYESLKIILKKSTLIPLIILLAAKCYYSYFISTDNDSFADHVYHEYMVKLEGELTQEKINYISEEREDINNILASFDETQQAYLQDKIDYESFSAYLSEYNYAYSRNEHFQIIEDHRTYLQELSEAGKSAWFLYDTGWKKLLFSRFDWTLYAAIIIITAGCFVIEYEMKSSSGCFSNILRSTRKGRTNTFYQKYFVTLLFAILFTLIWNCVDFVQILLSYDLRDFSAPIWSIEDMKSFPINIALWQYLIVFYSTRVFSIITLVLLICSLSAICTRYITVMSVTLLTTISPSILSNLGVSVLNKFDYTQYMRATPLLLTNLSITYVSICCIICTLLTLLAKRRWTQ